MSKIHLLYRLAQKEPEEFFNHPDLQLFTRQDTSKWGSGWKIKLCLKLCSLPEAPSDFLSFAGSVAQKFYKYSWRWGEVLILVASHRNTSQETLLQISLLGEHIISEFAKVRMEYPNDDNAFWNQVSLRRQPALFRFIPRKHIFQLLRSPNLSPNVSRALLQFHNVDALHNIIANHPMTPRDVLEHLAISEDPFISEAARLHINYDEDLQEKSSPLEQGKANRNLPRLENEAGIEMRLWQAGIIVEDFLPYLVRSTAGVNLSHWYDEDCPVNLLRIISSRFTPKGILDMLERCSVLPSIAVDCISYVRQREDLFLEKLPRSFPVSSDNVVRHFLNNRIIPPITKLDDLVERLDDKRWLAKKRLLTLEIPSLAACLVNFFSSYLGQQKNLSYDLREMFKDFNQARYRVGLMISNEEYFGAILASCPESTAKTLSRLVKHPFKSIRCLVARHPNVSQNSLAILINDPESIVRMAAIANSNLQPNWKELDRLNEIDLASAELANLADNSCPAIRIKVAQHGNTDSSTLAKLSKDKFFIRLAVAKHPNTPANNLVELLMEQDCSIHLAVAQNPSTPDNVLVELATQSILHGGFNLNQLQLAAIGNLFNQGSDKAVGLIERCLKFPERSSFSRFLLLMNCLTPQKFLAQSSQSWFWTERYAIAQNPNTPTDTLLQLSHDPNRIVVAAAMANLSTRSTDI